MIVLTVHSSGIDGSPSHLRGDGGPDCATCHPPMFPATLLLPEDPHVAAALARLSERVGVVEQILSDSIPEQPWEAEQREGEDA